MGTAIKGGVEGLKMFPSKQQEKRMEIFRKLLDRLLKDGKMEPSFLAEFEKPVMLSKSKVLLFQLFSKIGIANFYWDKQLKENGVFDRRFDCPYREK